MSSPLNIPFTKMHGLGNDFVVINNLEQNIVFTPNLIQLLSNRHRGVGCDQVLILEPSTEKNSDFYYRIFNNDGSEVGQCGNGARCLAKFIHDEKLSHKNTVSLQTITAYLESDYQTAENIIIKLSPPKNIKPFSLNNHSGFEIDLGNPHIVFIVTEHTPILNNLNLNNYNIGFMKILSREHIQLRVFERGVGETEACGSGACAAVVAGITQKLLNNTVTVELRGGKLDITWNNQNSPILMKGPAVTVFKGHFIYNN